MSIYLSFYLSIFLSVYLSIHLSIYLSICLSVCLSCLKTVCQCLSELSIHPSSYLWLYIHSSKLFYLDYLSIYLSICVSTYLPIYLSTYLSRSILSIDLSICLSELVQSMPLNCIAPENAAILSQTSYQLLNLSRKIIFPKLKI